MIVFIHEKKKWVKDPHMWEVSIYFILKYLLNEITSVFKKGSIPSGYMAELLYIFLGGMWCLKYLA